MTAAYLVLALAVDRVLAIVRPFWHRQLKFSLFARKIVLGIVSAAIVIALPSLYIAQPNESDTTCARRRSVPVIAVVQTAIVILIPAAALIGSNVMFVRRLARRKKSKTVARGPVKSAARLASHMVTTQKSKKFANEQNYLKLLLLTTCSYLSLSLATVALSRIGWLYYSQQHEQDDESKEALWDLVNVPVVVNSSVNFIFYYASGPMFREAVKKTFLKTFSTLATTQNSERHRRH